MGGRVRAKFQMSKGVISNQNIKKKLQGAEKRERVEWGGCRKCSLLQFG